MKNQELFDRTVGILVKAYLNETLVHQDSCGCAVGNLVYQHRDKSNFGVIKKGFDVHAPWFKVAKRFNKDFEGLQQIKSTGYTISEINNIEISFERGGNVVNDKDGFKGLMSVVDYLAEIHEADTEETANAKSLFTKELTV
jgi:hypothetical protein